MSASRPLSLEVIMALWSYFVAEIGFLKTLVRKLSTFMTRHDLGQHTCCRSQVRPVLSYLVLAINLGVYAIGIGIALTAGGEASNDYFLQLAKVNEEVLNGQYWRCDADAFGCPMLSEVMDIVAATEVRSSSIKLMHNVRALGAAVRPASRAR